MRINTSFLLKTAGLLCLVLIMTAGLALTAMADENPAIEANLWGRNGTTTTTNAILPEEEGTGAWYYDTYAGYIWFTEESYAACAAAYGGAPEWEITRDSGLDVWLELRSEDNGENEGCDIRIGGAPEEEGTYPIIIRCSWGEQIQKYTLFVKYVKYDDAPTGINIPNELNLQIGQTYTDTWTFDGNWEFQGEVWLPYGVRAGEKGLDELVDIHFEDNEVSITPKEGSAGNWPVWINLVDGNVGIQRLAVLSIADENGSTPELTTTVYPEAYFPEFPLFYTVFAGWDADTDLHIDERVGAATIDAEDYYVLKTLTGENPEWSVELIEGEGFDWFTLNMWDEDRENESVNIFLNSIPEETMDVTFAATCTWSNGLSETQEISFSFVDAVLPTEFSVDDPINMTVNQPCEVGFTLAPSNWKFTGEFSFDVVLFRDGYENNEDWSTIEPNWENGKLTLTSSEVGTFYGVVILRDGPLNYICKYLTFNVADENGNVPGFELCFGDEDAYNRSTTFTRFDDNDETGLHHQTWTGNYWINDTVYNTLVSVYGEPRWSAEFSGGSEDVVFNAGCWDDGNDQRGLDVWIDEIPDDAQYVEITVSCSFTDEISTSTVLHVDFESADSLPTGVTFGGEYHGLKVGETYAIPVEWEPEDYHLTDRTWVDFDANFERDNWWDWKDGKRVQYIRPKESGVFWAEIAINEGNLRMSRSVLLYVQDENGEEPELNPVLNRDEETFTFAFPVGYPEEILEDSSVFVERHILSLWLENYNEIRAMYGSDLHWEFTVTNDTADTSGYANENYDDRGCVLDVHIGGTPETTGELDAEIKLVTEDDRVVLTRNLHVDFVEVTYPTGIKVDREYHMTVGERRAITASYLPANHKGNFSEPTIGIGINDFPGSWEECLEVEYDGATAYVTAKEPGTYVVWVDLYDWPITTTTNETVVIYVADENGNVPVLAPVVYDQEYTMSIAPADDKGFDVYVSNGDVCFVRPDNEEQLFGLYGDDYEMTFEVLDGPAVEMAAPYNSDLAFDLQVTNLNEMKPGTTSKVEATLRWGEGVTKFTITIDFIQMEMPDSVELPEVVDMHPDDTARIEAFVTPGDFYEDYFLWLDPGASAEGNLSWWEESSLVKYVHAYGGAGGYYEYPHLHAANVFIRLPGIAFRVVEDEDALTYLVLPEGLAQIEDEAFEGIAANVVVIPESCTSIGSRAFADCPNLIEVRVAPNDRLEYVADDAFEGTENWIVTTY